MTADGTRAYIALNGADRVAVIDLNKHMLVAQIATGKGPDGLKWLRDQ